MGIIMALSYINRSIKIVYCLLSDYTQSQPSKLIIGVRYHRHWLFHIKYLLISIIIIPKQCNSQSKGAIKGCGTDNNFGYNPE